MRKLLYLVISLLILWPAVSLAQTSTAPIVAAQNTFYYSSTCVHCKKVEAFFKDYGVVEKYNIVSKEISQNPANAKELFELMSARNIAPNDMGVPYLDFEGQGYFGDVDIIAFFKTKMGITDTTPKISPAKSTSQPHQLTVWAVTVAALADSINPCAFSVIIFLLLSLLAIGSKKRALKVGITYIVTVYVVYLAAGLGLLAALQWLAPISKYIMTGAAILAILAGLVNIKDFFWYGKGFTLAIPEDKKPIMEKYIKQASIPAAVILGFLVALFELPCTGGFYLAILALLAAQTTFITGLGYLVFYNLIFVLPLFIILGVVYKGVKPAHLEAWRTTNRKWLRLVMGLALVAIGLSLIFLF